MPKIEIYRKAWMFLVDMKTPRDSSFESSFMLKKKYLEYPSQYYSTKILRMSQRLVIHKVLQLHVQLK
jgi:hypothetical protein